MKDVEFIALKTSEEVYEERKVARADREQEKIQRERLEREIAEQERLKQEQIGHEEQSAIAEMQEQPDEPIQLREETTADGKRRRPSGRTRDQKKRSWLYELGTTVLYCAIAIVLVLLIKQFVVQKTLVEGRSMVETLHNHDQLLVDKISYRFSDPKRFDIIVLEHPTKEDVYYIKRIIGLPGETVQIVGTDILINGEKLEESYGAEQIQFPGLAQEPITLAQDTYFVMGDNRNNSSDSRDPNVGNVPRENIVGRAFLRIWPLDRFGTIE